MKNWMTATIITVLVVGLCAGILYVLSQQETIPTTLNPATTVAPATGTGVPTTTTGVVTPEVVTPQSQMIQIPEEYKSSVNVNITLEQLKNSKLVRDGVEISNAGGPAATAHAYIFKAEVREISGRTLTLTREGETMPIFVGKDAKIGIVKGTQSAEGKWEDIKLGNLVNIACTLQFTRGDPLVVTMVMVYK